jgi:hypothetical protein
VGKVENSVKAMIERSAAYRIGSEGHAGKKGVHYNDRLRGFALPGLSLFAAPITLNL